MASKKRAAHPFPARRQTGRHDRRTLVDSPHVHARSVYRLAGWRSITPAEGAPYQGGPPRQLLASQHLTPMTELAPAVARTEPLRVPRTIVLVGLMGAGKSAIGRRLAARLNLPF